MKKITFFLIFYAVSTFADSPLELLTYITDEHSDDFLIPIEGIGDMNGDGFDDFAVGAMTGRYVKIYFGGSSIDTSNYIKIENCSVASISGGDYNGDGYKDLIIGEPDAVYYYKGRAQLYMGGENISSDPQLIFSRKSLEHLGNTVSFIGDVNNDGFEDIAISAEGPDFGYPGRVYIHHGSTTLDTIPEFILDGKDSGDMFGKYVTAAGDVNGDGFDDFLIGAPRYPAPGHEEYVYLFFGGDSINFNNAIEIRDTTQSHLESCGEMIAGLGDINGDNYDDFAIMWCRKVSVYYGSSNFHNETAFETLYNFMYKCISELGDINKDSYNDYAIISDSFDLFLGGATNDTTPDYSEASFSASYIANFGDINQDGKSDIGISRKPRNVFIYSYNTTNSIQDFNNQSIEPIFILKPSYPNPFNSCTNIQYQINCPLNIEVKIYNNQGQYIQTLFSGKQQPGLHTHLWNGKDEAQHDVTSGIYFLKIMVIDKKQLSESKTQKLVLVK